ncbi:MAG: DMT family transporter [Clostridia bacterium]|nr:DMT family transporter [Clostridia bacterium]
MSDTVSTKKSLISSALLVLTALVWGVGFVAQSAGSKYVKPFTFSCVRFLITAAALLVVILIKSKFEKHEEISPEQRKKNKKTLIVSGIITGVFLCVGTNLQQIGITMGASAGKAGFLTATYIIMVPILALIIFRKKCAFNVWIGVAISLVGLYLLCMKGEFRFETADIILLLCALGFSFQILFIDLYVSKIDAIKLSCVEFLICGILSAIPMLITETFDDTSAWLNSFTVSDAWLAILYAAIVSGGIGFTLQTVVQKNVAPARASLIMCFESVFGALSGWIILGQGMTTREIIGSVLMFIAIVVSQLEFNFKQKNKPPENFEQSDGEKG